MAVCMVDQSRGLRLCRRHRAANLGAAPKQLALHLRYVRRRTGAHHLRQVCFLINYTSPPPRQAAGGIARAARAYADPLGVGSTMPSLPHAFIAVAAMSIPVRPAQAAWSAGVPWSMYVSGSTTLRTG